MWFVTELGFQSPHRSLCLVEVDGTHLVALVLNGHLEDVFRSIASLVPLVEAVHAALSVDDVVLLLLLLLLLLSAKLPRRIAAVLPNDT